MKPIYLREYSFSLIEYNVKMDGVETWTSLATLYNVSNILKAFCCQMEPQLLKVNKMTHDE